jgi:hypothetical protein
MVSVTMASMARGVVPVILDLLVIYAKSVTIHTNQWVNVTCAKLAILVKNVMSVT